MEARTPESYIKNAHTHPGPEGSHTHCSTATKCKMWRCQWINDAYECSCPDGCSIEPLTTAPGLNTCICVNFKDSIK